MISLMDWLLGPKICGGYRRHCDHETAKVRTPGTKPGKSCQEEFFGAYAEFRCCRCHRVEEQFLDYSNAWQYKK